MKSLFLLFLLSCSAIIPAQSSQPIANQATHFQLPTPTDTIDFLIVDTAGTRSRKPILLWCQGSEPTPLFVDYPDFPEPYLFGGGISNFDYRAIARDYHLVVVSMPHIPVVAPAANVNAQSNYIPDSTKPQETLLAFVEDDYLRNHVDRGTQVLDYLRRQPWVDTTRLVVAGHSQGSKVAAKLARANAAVTHLGLFGANPFGRIDQHVRAARLDAELGRISWAKADSLMDAEYDRFRSAHDSARSAADPGSRATRSFAEPFYDDWLALDIPIYLAYGTADITAALCDIVPFYFIAAGKDTLTLKRYLELEHNFFGLQDGRPNYDDDHWPEVMAEFVAWIE